MVCTRCGHVNEESARFCSSCGAPLLGDEETTLSLAAVEAADLEEDLARYLHELPEGIGILVVRHGPTVGSSYRLDQPHTSIGRHPESDIFLDDITISRRHVTIDRDASGFALHDAGSLNGTYVNRERVDHARLRTGDEVQIGRYRLSFVQGVAADG